MAPIRICFFCLAFWSCAQAAEQPPPLFFQDFNAGNQVATYHGDGDNQFDFIGVTGAPGNYVEEVVDGDLILRTLPNPAGGEGGQGFVRKTDYTKGAEALRVEFELALNNKLGPPNTFAALEFGDELPASFRSNSKVEDTRFLKLEFKKSNKQSLMLSNKSKGEEVFVDLGSAALSGAIIQYQIILNDSPKSMMYAAPGGLGSKHVSPGRMSLYYNAGDGWVHAFDDIPTMNGGAADLSEFRFARVRVDKNEEAANPALQDPCLAAWRRIRITAL